MQRQHKLEIAGVILSCFILQLPMHGEKASSLIIIVTLKRRNYSLFSLKVCPTTWMQQDNINNVINLKYLFILEAEICRSRALTRPVSRAPGINPPFILARLWRLSQSSPPAAVNSAITLSDTDEDVLPPQRPTLLHVCLTPPPAAAKANSERQRLFQSLTSCVYNYLSDRSPVTVWRSQRFRFVYYNLQFTFFMSIFETLILNHFRA